MTDKTDQEIIDWLKIDAENDGNTEAARMKYAAAERIRVLGEECEAWRGCPTEHFSKVWDQPQMSGAHRSEYRQKINDARAATDAAKGGSR